MIYVKSIENGARGGIARCEATPMCMIRQKTSQEFKKSDLKIEKLLPGLEKNVLLKNQTTFRIGGKAQYFFKAQTKQDLIKVLKMAKKINLPFFILGGGSNILAADEGYKGIVIKMQNANFKFQTTKIYAEAGVLLSSLVSEATKNNLTGLEWAAGIPGTVGGAINGNTGAFGRSIKDILKSVEVLNVKNLKIKTFRNRDCKFNYRDSVFKKNKNQSTKQSLVLGRAPSTQNLSARCSDLIILSAEFQLKRGNPKNIEKKIKKYLKIRKEKIPCQFSAGSVFKNIKKQALSRRQLKLIPPQRIKGGKISSAYLIEESGLKGKVIGGAKISEKHANFIINLGKAKSKDVLKLIDLVKNKVKKRFGIVLEKEIELIP